MEVNIYSLHKTTFATINRAKTILQESQNHILLWTVLFVGNPAVSCALILDWKHFQWFSFNILDNIINRLVWWQWWFRTLTSCVAGRRGLWVCRLATRICVPRRWNLLLPSSLRSWCSLLCLIRQIIKVSVYTSRKLQYNMRVKIHIIPTFKICFCLLAVSAFL